MLYQLLPDKSLYVLFSGAAAFLLTLTGLVIGRKYLPKDQGREFAVNGGLSKGKARGAGLILVAVLIMCAILFLSLDAGMIVFLAALFFEMMSGYLDDASEKPWGELVKGLIDLAIAAVAAIIAYRKTGGVVTLSLLHTYFTMEGWLYIPLAIIMIWVSINVTNCADGVDGLCTSLSITTLSSALLLLLFAGDLLPFGYSSPLGCIVDVDYSMCTLVWMSLFVLIAYLWFNCSPSSMLMGDAGSRALGLLIAMAFLWAGDPFLFIPCALLLIMDGGLGLFKLTVLRLTKSKTFMKNLRTPIHDHARKNKGWSDTQVVTRFTLVQILLSAGTLALVCNQSL